MVRFTIRAFSVDIDAYQWGYIDGTAYFERDLGVTPYGVWHRERIVGVTARVLEVRFAQQNSVSYQLRALGIQAMRTGGRVQFFPDTLALATFQWVDWATLHQSTRLVENRLEQRIVLIQQPG